MDESPDPSLPLRAAQLFAETQDSSASPDLLHVLIDCLQDGAEMTRGLGFEWRTGELGRVEMLRFQSSIPDGRRMDQLSCAVHTRLQALERLSKILPADVLNFAAADIRPTYEMFVVSSF